MNCNGVKWWLHERAGCEWCMSGARDAAVDAAMASFEAFEASKKAREGA